MIITKRVKNIYAIVDARIEKFLSAKRDILENYGRKYLGCEVEHFDTESLTVKLMKYVGDENEGFEEVDWALSQVFMYNLMINECRSLGEEIRRV